MLAVPFLYSLSTKNRMVFICHINKKDGTANRFGSAVPSSFWLVISVPLGDTFGAFDASLDIREDQHDVVQLIS